MMFTSPRAFSIPDEWWDNAGMRDFTANAPSYQATSEPGKPFTIVKLEDIEPPTRDDGVRWFDRERMSRILAGFVASEAMPPIEVHELPKPNGFRYGLRNGFHRFYASAAAGFPSVPVIVRPYFDIKDPHA